MRSGSLWPRPTWAPATAGRGGSASPGAWLTPAGIAGLDHTGKAGAGGEFAQQATTWTTPTALERSGQGERNKALVLDVKAWATPDCNTSSYSNGLMGPNIRQQASAWPTPSAAVVNDGESPEAWHARAETLKAKHGNGNGAGLPLTVATAQWPTPVTRDHHAQGAGNQQKSPALGTITAQWPTPVSSDSRSQLGESMPGRIATRTASPSLSQVVTHSHSLPQAQPTPDGPPSSPTAPNSPRHLSPLFGAWLMGWPSTWVIAEPHASSASATVLWRSKLQQHLSRLFSEQEG